MKIRPTEALAALLTSILSLTFSSPSHSANLPDQPTGARLSVNWYHGREFFEPIVDAFTRRTGIEVDLVDAYSTYNTDVVFIPDVLETQRAKLNGKFRRLALPDVARHIPSQYRDPEDRWYGVAIRARTAVYAPDRVRAQDLRSYDDLLSPRLRGRVCMRTSTYDYDRSFLAAKIANDGELAARTWARGIVENMHPKVNGDTNNVVRVAEGECDVALVNTYYLGYMLTGRWEMAHGETRRLNAAKAVKVAYLDQNGRGSWGNVTAVGIAARSRFAREAQAFVRFVLSKEGQALLTSHVHKFPVRRDVAPSDYLRSLGPVRFDPVPMHRLIPFYPMADEIYQSVGWP